MKQTIETEAYLSFLNVNGIKINNSTEQYRFNEITITAIEKNKEHPLCPKAHLEICGEERGKGKTAGSDIFGLIDFNNNKNFEKAKKGLKLLQEALSDEAMGEK